MASTQRELPTRETLLRFHAIFPEINVSSVELLLLLVQTFYEIQHQIYDDLEKRYKLSEGKLSVMMCLYQEPKGVAPSKLAAMVGVTRATISVMVRRLIRDKLACSVSDPVDRRGRLLTLTDNGKQFLNDILPDHYRRTARLMERLTEDEQQALAALLYKINAKQMPK